MANSWVLINGKWVDYHDSEAVVEGWEKTRRAELARQDEARQRANQIADRIDTVLQRRKEDARCQGGQIQVDKLIVLINKAASSAALTAVARELRRDFRVQVVKGKTISIVVSPKQSKRPARAKRARRQPKTSRGR